MGHSPLNERSYFSQRRNTLRCSSGKWFEEECLHESLCISRFFPVSPDTIWSGSLRSPREFDAMAQLEDSFSWSSTMLSLCPSRVGRYSLTESKEQRMHKGPCASTCRLISRMKSEHSSSPSLAMSSPSSTYILWSGQYSSIASLFRLACPLDASE